MADFPFGWNNFTWWLSDQKYQTQSWRYFKGYAMDTQRFDVRPTNSNSLFYTYPSSVNAIFSLDRLSANSDKITWLNNGKIYYESTEVASIAWTAKQWYRIAYMKPSWSTIYKLYYFHDTPPSIPTKYIHRSNIDGTTFEENYRSYTSDSWNPFLSPPSWMVVLSEWRRILFSYYNEIWEMSNTEVLTKLVSFGSEENVVWITQFLWEYKIYTTSSYATSKIYKWDWLSSNATVSVDLNGLAITWWVTSLWAIDYMIADNSFYEVSWVQYQKLYDNISGRILLAYDEKVILEQSIDSKIAICEYSYKPWYNFGVHPKLITDINNQWTWVNSIIYTTNWLMFSVWTKLYKPTGTVETWTVTPFIESMVYIGSNIQYEKIIKELIFKFSWLTTTNILLYAQKNENWTWIKLFEWNNNTISTSNHGLKIPANTLENAVWTFNTIRFRIEMPHTWQAQWRFYGLDWILTENVWK